MKLKATSIDFTNLLQLDSIVNSLSPETKLDNLNAYLYYDHLKNEINIVTKGSQAFSSIKINATIEPNDNDLCLMFYLDNVKHLVSNYSDEQKESIVMSIVVEDDTSVFKFKTKQDTINFAHLLLKGTEITDIKSLIDICGQSSFDEIYIDSSNLPDKENFMTGLDTCINFIDDDATNNAVAIYNDRMVASSSKHIYIYNFQNKLSMNMEPVFLHKKIAKTILILHKKKGEMRFYLSDSANVVIEDSKFKFVAMMNNRMSSVIPPSEDDLLSLRPTLKVVDIPVPQVIEIIKFFGGFYTSKVFFKTIALTVQKESLKFVLKNSGVAGFNSSHVERTLDIDTKGSFDVESMLLITSIDSFVSSLNKEDIIEMFVDKDHKAMVLKVNKQEIFLPKLT